MTRMNDKRDRLIKYAHAHRVADPGSVKLDPARDLNKKHRSDLKTVLIVYLALREAAKNMFFSKWSDH